MQTIRTIAALAAVVTVIGGPLAIDHARAADLEKLDLTYIPSNSIYWDLDVGVDKGFFKAEGFNAQILSNQSSPQSMQMLISGQVEIAISQPDPLIAAIEKGAKTIGVIAAPATEADWFLVGKKGVKNIEDLKGQTLGFSSLRVGEFYLTRNILKEHGIDAKDFSAIQIGPTPAKYAALQKGSIAAGVLFQPTATLAQQNGFPVLVRFAQAIKGFPAIVYLSNRRLPTTTANALRARSSASTSGCTIRRTRTRPSRSCRNIPNAAKRRSRRSMTSISSATSSTARTARSTSPT
jgi:ABC-type nitrate/sulfonate/bicarbonate transport system substrate-binding protein